MKRLDKEMLYVYDFGDNWEHALTVEWRAARTNRFICLSGTDHPIAEDCSGVKGWEELKETYRTSSPIKDQEEKRRKQWRSSWP